MPERGLLHGWLQDRWYGVRPPWVLRPLSMLYSAVVAMRHFVYRRGWLRSTHPGVPVVVVGNLVVGGTGKTPLVLWLAQQLGAQGIRVGIVLRGYGGAAHAPEQVTARSDPAQVGDEAVLLARRTQCLVCVAVRRPAAARELAAAGCELILSDDGLQHLALRRDLEIVVVDGARGFGNGALLPAGPLREPLRRLHAVDLVVVNGCAQRPLPEVTGIPLQMQLRPQVLEPVAAAAPLELSALRGMPVHAVAGTGNPQRFFDLLREQGLEVIGHAFPDHHRYAAAELAFPDEYPILMTEKDAVKCSAFATGRMYFLPVAAGFSDADAKRLLQAVMACMARSRGGRTGA